MEFFDISSPWIWIALAGLFIIFEFAIAGSFYPLMIAFGLLLSGLFAVFTDNSYFLVGVFVGVSIVATLLIRPLLVKTFKVDKDVRPSAMDALIGATAVVTKPISKHERGEIKFEGERWSATTDENEEYAVQEEVIILRIEGITAVVQSKRG